MAARQHGVISRHQLREVGVTDASIATAVASGRLHRVFRNVFAVGYPQDATHSRMLAATLACGPGTVVSHRSAAALLGMWDHSPSRVEVIAPNQEGRGIEGIRTRHVPFPQREETGHCASIPCTSPSRTLVDLAGVMSERLLRRVVERTAVLDLLDPPGAERALTTARRRGAPVLRTILHDWHEDGGARPPSKRGRHLRSELEARLLALVRAGGLPTPLCNYLLEADGNRFEADFLWPKQRLVVETDGRRYHDNGVAFERDRLRDRALHLSGYRVVRVTTAQMERESDAIVSAIRRLLADGPSATRAGVAPGGESSHPVR